MPYRILVVDADDAHSSAVSKILQKAAFEIVRIGTGAGALTCASKYRPNLILLDTHLPDADSYDIALLLRSEAGTNSIPIILHSAGHVADGSRIAAVCGARAFLTHPIAPDHLLEVVREGLAKTASKHSLASRMRAA